MVKIGRKEVMFGEPTYVIAEIGINHNGDMKIAKQLVDIAAKAGCDSAKFQTFKETELNFKNLTYPEFTEIKKYCDSKNIQFLSTPHSISAIDFLANLVPAYKLASPFITNDYFVKRVRMKNKPIIASTGSVSHENKRATYLEVNHFLQFINNHIVILYCISKYPCYNFDVDDFVKFVDYYSRYPVGISCHYPGIDFSVDAVKNGACMVEKHITLDDDFDCPDKKVSLNPDKLNELVTTIKSIDRGEL